MITTQEQEHRTLTFGNGGSLRGMVATSWKCGNGVSWRLGCTSRTVRTPRENCVCVWEWSREWWLWYLWCHSSKIRALFIAECWLSVAGFCKWRDTWLMVIINENFVTHSKCSANKCLFGEHALFGELGWSSANFGDLNRYHKSVGSSANFVP